MKSEYFELFSGYCLLAFCLLNGNTIPVICSPLHFISRALHFAVSSGFPQPVHVPSQLGLIKLTVQVNDNALKWV